MLQSLPTTDMKAVVNFKYFCGKTAALKTRTLSSWRRCWNVLSQREWQGGADVLKQLHLFNGSVLKVGRERKGLRSDHFSAAEEQTAFTLQRAALEKRTACSHHVILLGIYLSTRSHPNTSSHSAHWPCAYRKITEWLSISLFLQHGDFACTVNESAWN